MKKFMKIFIVLSALMLLTGCSNKKEDLREVSFGNLAFHYDANVWKYNEKRTAADPVELSDAKGNLLTISVSQESTYQHPMEMIRFLELMNSANDGYEVFKEPAEVKVNGTAWYEYGYSYRDGSSTRKIYHRYYGKYYNAASISYLSTEEAYQSGYEEALKLMADITVTDVPNEANEAEAHKFLVGEWDIAKSGYLVLNEDGTYEWYKDSTKDKNNMHHGTYGCDVENATMELNKGDGIYLVLFPEELIINGGSEKPSSYKVDYIISFASRTETDGYQMVNMSSYNLYTITKQ